MTKQILSALKVVALALALSLGISYALAWNSPSQQPPNGNTAAPLNVSATAQTKTGNLTVNGLSAGTLQVTGGTPAANKVLTSDASGNATWQTPAVGAGDNLGNHTATQALNMGTFNINAGGSNGTYGAITVQGEKNTWSGMQFKNAAGTNSGTLMMSPSYSGFYNTTDNNWRMYVTDGGAGSYGNVYANDYYSFAAGKWMSSIATASTHGKQKFTSSGTFTVPAGVTTVWVTMSGGGGGGVGSCGYGGGGAATAVAQQLTVTAGASYPITIGAGGSGGGGGPSCLAGTAGGASSFGALLTTNGGGGATSSAPGASGGFGGAAGVAGGTGGGSIYGVAGVGSNSGTGYGAGGGGGASYAAGGGGSAGFVLVEW